ncbi:MAG: hypothetical protein AB4040_14590 [Synechococcus sp.]
MWRELVINDIADVEDASDLTDIDIKHAERIMGGGMPLSRGLYYPDGTTDGINFSYEFSYENEDEKLNLSLHA